LNGTLLVDSACSTSIVNKTFEGNFTDLHCIPDTLVKGVGGFLIMKQKGTFNFAVHDDSGVLRNVSIPDVYFHPDATVNLLSVAQFNTVYWDVRFNCKSTGGPHLFYSGDPFYGVKIPLTPRAHGLWSLLVEPTRAKSLACSAIASAFASASASAAATTAVSQGSPVGLTSEEFAHFQYGHISASKLKCMQGQVRGIHNFRADKVKSGTFKNCPVCRTANSTKRKSPSASKREHTRDKDTWHIDLFDAGVENSSIHGYRYCTIVISKFSRYCVVELHKRKSDIGILMPKIISKMGYSPAVIISDRECWRVFFHPCGFLSQAEPSH